ncbi:MAG: hypothetical protein WD492_09225 [Alkalispirochaeta sp.]
MDSEADGSWRRVAGLYRSRLRYNGITTANAERGRYSYSQRMGTVEPVFGNAQATLGLDRFTL